MKKSWTCFVSFSLFFLTINNASAMIPSPVSGSKPKTAINIIGGLEKKISFGRGCDGQTDNAHESKHVPRTVNVEALTECPKQEVSITTTISRHGWWIFPDTKSVSGQGYQKVEVNVALPCKWRKGQPSILYVVISHHSDSEGQQENTETKSYVNC